MPINRNALIRYQTIDKCLRNRYRKWTLEDLIDACSDALYEYEGIDKGVSRRTVQADIQTMRSDKLGYHAPIIVVDKKYYTYEDPDYSITNIPLTDADLGKLTEVVEILKQFRGFSHFKELGGMVQRLEDKVHAASMHQEPVIDFEKNENLKGLEYLDELYQAIIKKKPLKLSYQSFRARHPSTFNFHPWLLKEYRNRWFVIGIKKRKSPLINLALDRITSIEETEENYIENNKGDLHAWFRDVIGVTVNEGDAVQDVQLFVDHSHAPYVLTKPIHHSQELIGKTKQGVIISLRVKLNFELEREILGFGDSVKVLTPDRLKHRIRNRLEDAVSLYDRELSDKELNIAHKKLIHKGFAQIGHVYSRRECERMKTMIRKMQDEMGGKDAMPAYGIRQLLQKAPGLKDLIFNDMMNRILESMVGENLRLIKSIFFDKTADANWFVGWHQDATINLRQRKSLPGWDGWTQKEDLFGVNPPKELLKQQFTIRIHLDDTDENNGALRVISGTHQQRLSDDEIREITESATPVSCESDAGGILLMKPLLLHSSSKSKSGRPRRVIHLEFSTAELPEGLAWGEAMEF